MSLLEIIGRALLFIIVIPLFALLCVVWAVIIMTAALLVAPVVCVVSLFFKDPYSIVGWFYKKALWLASVPFEWYKVNTRIIKS